MKEYEELIKDLERQEQNLVFEEFDADLALKIGLELIEEAKRRKNKIAVDISAFGRTLFHFSSNGNAPSNDEMLRRKRNTALYTGHSSLWAHYMLADIGMTIDEKWHLDPGSYADVGGAFPVRVRSCGGVVGSITASGFSHQEDHGIVIDVLKKLSTDK
jgi:uncharacterized protein (UPF0303 family)